MITKEQIEMLKSALSDIGNVYGEVVILRYYYDFSYEEIARLQGISAANARMRCSRALRLIKERRCYGMKTKMIAILFVVLVLFSSG